MKRRSALASSLLLTTIAGFVIAAYGSRVGLFGSDANAGADAAAVAIPTATVAAPPARPKPVVVDKYVYQDQYVVDDSGSSAQSPASRPATEQGSSSGASPAPATSSHDDDEGDDDHGDDADDAYDDDDEDEEHDGDDDGHDGDQSVEFHGTVVATTSTSFTVDTSSGQLVVALDGGSRVHGGALAPGARVEVHARQLADGSLVAGEVEVEDD